MFIVKSPETHVLDLIAYYVPIMANTVNMWIETGTISSTTENFQFGPVLLITGCDTVPSLFGIRNNFSTL